MRKPLCHRLAAAALAGLMWVSLAAPSAALPGLQSIRTDITKRDSTGRPEAKTEHQYDQKGQQYQTRTIIERDGQGKVRKTTAHTYKVSGDKLQLVRTVRIYAAHKVGKLIVDQYRTTTEYDDLGRPLVELREYELGGKVAFAYRRTTEYIPGTGSHKPVKKEYRTDGKWQDGSKDAARDKARDEALRKARKAELERGPFSQDDAPGVSDEGQHLLVPGRPVLNEGPAGGGVHCDG